MILFELIYVALPAFVANMMPVFAARFNIAFLHTPVDGGRVVRGIRILGDHKTWRGFVAAILGSVLVVMVQYFEPVPISFSVYEPSTLVWAIFYGAYIGLLVMVGDMLGSFIKRQFGFASGKPCIPLDQIDYITVFILGTLPFIAWTLPLAAVLVLFTFFLNLGTNALAYVTGVKNTYW